MFRSENKLTLTFFFLFTDQVDIVKATRNTKKKVDTRREISVEKKNEPDLLTKNWIIAVLWGLGAHIWVKALNKGTYGIKNVGLFVGLELLDFSHNLWCFFGGFYKINWVFSVNWPPIHPPPIKRRRANAWPVISIKLFLVANLYHKFCR